MAKNILIVDDDPSMQGLYRSMFGWRTKGEFTLHLLTTGEAVLPFLWDDKVPTVDLVILDWDLPGKSGLEVLRSIASNPAEWRFPVIMMTGNNDDQRRDDALRAGAEGYFVKPFPVDELLARVRELLRSRESARED